MVKDVKLKSGLEIHQQLDTRKLFCNCPSILRQEEPDYIIERKLHAVAGETGEVDIAAKHEASKELSFEYECYNDNTCLVELDEEPPHQIDKEALKIAVQISLLLNSEIIQNTQVMRKTVINGSNVSGFQRTVLIARNGYIETSEGRVGIESIALEEDAARKTKKLADKVIYRLDRLGIPLVEIATRPDIKSPEQAKEVALHIGEILRSCKVKRGIGTIRQDINISIPGHPRIEIKGFQDPKIMIKTVENEIARQEKNLKSKKKLEGEVRNALPDGKTEFLRPLPGAARMYPETDLPLLHISRELINEAKKTLPKLKSELRSELKHRGLSEELIKLILQENKMNEFHELLHICPNANVVAKSLVLWPREIKIKLKVSDEKFDEKIHIDTLETILKTYRDKLIDESDIKPAIEKIIKGTSVKDALKKEKIENLEDEILKIVKEKPGLSINAYMGLAMAKFKGKVSGKDIMEILKRVVK
jgi:Glu-tRNA(Gln) amidotransferase subunit E-like FAD-binding protein